MNIYEIKKVIQDQEIEKEKIFRIEKIIEREAGKNKGINALKYPNIFAVLGVRRCGKSIFSQLILKNKKFGYINFDDEVLYGIKARELNYVLRSFYELYGVDLEYIILDEIQNVSGWELFANKLRKTKKVIITGSNSKLLSGELATHLTGRYIDFELFPFSFREFLKYNDVSIEKLKRYEYSTDTYAIGRKMLQNYIASGSFPETYKFGKDILKPIFRDIITKDVVRRYRIKNINTIEEVAKYLVSNFSKEISYNKLKNIFEIKKISTIKNYVSYLKDAYLLLIFERFSLKLKQQFIAPKKIYCIDTGIINTIGFKFSENLGRLYENLVGIELFRRKAYWKEEMGVYYWKDYYGREVDFVLKEGIEVKELIQVCYDIDEYATKEREVKSLLKASKELKCNNLLIITEDYEGEEEHKGKKVKFVPLWKWLLVSSHGGNILHCLSNIKNIL